MFPTIPEAGATQSYQTPPSKSQKMLPEWLLRSVLRFRFEKEFNKILE